MDDLILMVLGLTGLMVAGALICAGLKVAELIMELRNETD
jgi:hypothetical protein